MSYTPSIGERVEAWLLYGYPEQPLTKSERFEVLAFASGFEECSNSPEELAAMSDEELIRAAYQAMAEYARGQM